MELIKNINYQQIIANENQQNTHKGVMCIWNENQRGEYESSMMVIIKRESPECMWNVYRPSRV